MKKILIILFITVTQSYATDIDFARISDRSVFQHIPDTEALEKGSGNVIVEGIFIRKAKVVSDRVGIDGVTGAYISSNYSFFDDIEFGMTLPYYSTTTINYQEQGTVGDISADMKYSFSESTAVYSTVFLPTGSTPDFSNSGGFALRGVSKTKNLYFMVGVIKTSDVVHNFGTLLGVGYIKEIKPEIDLSLELTTESYDELEKDIAISSTYKKEDYNVKFGVGTSLEEEKDIRMFAGIVWDFGFANKSVTSTIVKSEKKDEVTVPKEDDLSEEDYEEIESLKAEDVVEKEVKEPYIEKTVEEPVEKSKSSNSVDDEIKALNLLLNE
jgi:hypothetical protein